MFSFWGGFHSRFFVYRMKILLMLIWQTDNVVNLALFMTTSSTVGEHLQTRTR